MWLRRRTGSSVPACSYVCTRTDRCLECCCGTRGLTGKRRGPRTTGPADDATEAGTVPRDISRASEPLGLVWWATTATTGLQYLFRYCGASSSCPAWISVRKGEGPSGEKRIRRRGGRAAYILSSTGIPLRIRRSHMHGLSPGTWHELARLFGAGEAHARYSPVPAWPRHIGVVFWSLTMRIPGLPTSTLRDFPRNACNFLFQ